MEKQAIQFGEEKRNQPHWSGWYSRHIDHIDTYFTLNGAKFFLRGVADCAPDYEKAEIEDLKKQLINNDVKYVCYYAKDKNPLNFLLWVQQNNYSFEDFTKFRKLRGQNCWDFHGNLREYSAAFDYRFWDKRLAQKIRRLYYKLQKQKKVA